MGRLIRGIMKLALMSIGLFTVYAAFVMPNNTNNQNMEYIKSFINMGEISDVHNELNIGDIAEDCYFTVSKDKKEINIVLGNYTMSYNVSDFVTKDVQEQLEVIGIETRQNSKTLDFELKFLGTEILQKALRF